MNSESVQGANRNSVYDYLLVINILYLPWLYVALYQRCSMLVSVQCNSFTVTGLTDVRLSLMFCDSLSARRSLWRIRKLRAHSAPGKLLRNCFTQRPRRSR